MIACRRTSSRFDETQSLPVSPPVSSWVSPSIPAPMSSLLSLSWSQARLSGSALCLLTAISFAAIATEQLDANGLTALPEYKRTPLSEVIEDEEIRWRAPEEPEYQWRQSEKEVTINTNRRMRLFPEYDYETVDDPAERSLFQNEYEIERPRTNIFQYSF